MHRLRQSALDSIIPTLEQPVLGICLGMQLLFDESAEGDVHCLGIIPGRAERFAPAAGRPVPHMGWKRSRRAALRAARGHRRRRLRLLRPQLCHRIGAATVASCGYGAPFSACCSGAISTARNFTRTLGRRRRAPAQEFPVDALMPSPPPAPCASFPPSI